VNVSRRLETAASFDMLAKLRALADMHEQLAVELRQEVAVLSGDEPSVGELSRAKAVARKMLAFRRRLRSQYGPVLGDSFVQDPAFDLLLDVYISQADQKQVSLTGLRSATDASQTTALRWASRLCDAAVAIRTEDPRDHRREWFALENAFFVEMTAMLSQFGPVQS
jgi:hypothetical protein